MTKKAAPLNLVDEFPSCSGKRSSMALICLTCVWIGFILGVSFLATPAKFLVQSLPLAVALDVGRYTFGIFNKVEWVLTVALLIFAISSAARSWVLVACAVTAALVGSETFWLLPLLDERVSMIIANQQPPASHLHTVYVGLEIAKLMTLTSIAIYQAKETAAIAVANK